MACTCTCTIGIVRKIYNDCFKNQGFLRWLPSMSWRQQQAYESFAFCKVPSNLQYKPHIITQKCFWSLRCSWSIAYRRCSNYIFILDFTTWFQWIGQRQLQDETRSIWVVEFGAPYIRSLTACKLGIAWCVRAPPCYPYFAYLTKWKAFTCLLPYTTTCDFA